MEATLFLVGLLFGRVSSSGDVFFIISAAGNYTSEVCSCCCFTNISLIAS